IGIQLPERHLRVEPLRVLLVAVEDERIADESLTNELAHVAHRRRVAKREAELGLDSIGLRERRGTPRVVEVVGHWFFAQHVLAGLERGPGPLEVSGAWGADVDQIDVRALDELAMVATRRG